MHFYMLNIIEETDSEYKSELKLWENTEGKIWIQISMDENDPYATQGIPITLSDAKALIAELQRLVKGIEGHERASDPSPVSACKDDDYKPRQDGQGQQRANEGPAKQLMLTPEQPIQKVKWK